jgi:hypothetical protein
VDMRGGPPATFSKARLAVTLLHRRLLFPQSPSVQWLTPVIPATQEVEIGRIEAQSQPWANSL